MPQIPFTLDSKEGRIPVNWYPAKDDERGLLMIGSPGLRPLFATGVGPIRGMKVIGTTLWFVSGDTVYHTDNSFSAVSVGTIGTSKGLVFIEYNGIELCIVDGEKGYIVTIATDTLTQITAEGFPVPSSLTYQDSYFIVTEKDTQNFFISGLRDGLSWDALDFASAEAMPDNLVSVFMDHRELWLFGEETTQPFFNSGNTDFPFDPISGAYLEVGLAGKHAKAKVDNSIVWLTNLGQVVIAAGYNPQIISTRKLEEEWADFTWSTADAFSYVFNGHSFFQLAFPDDEKTYIYDAATKAWHERCRGELPNLHPSLGFCYARFDGKHLIGSRRDGNIYQLDSTYFYDGGETLTRILETPAVHKDGRDLFFSELEVHFESGRADSEGQGSDPQAMLQWSDDGGDTWGSEVWRPIGKIGEYKNKVVWHRLGHSDDRRFRLMITDPIIPTLKGYRLEMTMAK